MGRPSCDKAAVDEYTSKIILSNLNVRISLWRRSSHILLLRRVCICRWYNAAILVHVETTGTTTPSSVWSSIVRGD